MNKPQNTSVIDTLVGYANGTIEIPATPMGEDVREPDTLTDSQADREYAADADYAAAREFG